MYAIIKTGGKQYQVSAGDQLMVEKLEGNVGDQVEFDQVLLVSGDDTVTVGTPVVDGVTVSATIIEQGKHRKIKVFKKKKRKGYRLLKGHRQHYTALKISDINV
ncbi:MAG: 50S ribosomal protein L21 [Desulfofustis sp.]|jgi:large subunit ribosomal protein L21